MLMIIEIFFAVIQLILYIYLPLVTLYGMATWLKCSKNIDDLLQSPFLGIKRVSLSMGVKIWFFQLVLTGALFYEIAVWRLTGDNQLLINYINFI